MDSILHTVGVIGGLSHESSDGYSAGIHNLVNQTLGGLNNAELIQRDVNFAEVREDMLAGDWEDVGYYLANVADSLTFIGAEYVAVASNTIHRIAPTIEARIGSDRFIHIADCIGQRCVELIDGNRAKYPNAYSKDEPRRVLLLGTLETMEGDFLKDRLKKYDLTVDTPGSLDASILNDCIFSELCHGKITESTQKWYLRMIQGILTVQPVDAIILGCTELSLLYDEFNLAHLTSILNSNGDRPLSVVDSKQAHIAGLAKACLGQWKVSDL